MASRHALRRDPRAHWLLLSLTLAVVVAALLLEGYTNHGIGGVAPPRGRTCTSAPAALRDGRPIIHVAQDRVRTAAMPARTVALTFDGGPDPTWTPRVLEVLREHHVRATFFVAGAHAASHPDLVRRILAEGHEIGSHTYTEPDLGAIPAWRADMELSLTQNVLAGAAGVHTRLLRVPYTDTPASLCGRTWEAARRVGGAGYLLVAADRDSLDWRRLDAGAIVRAATPPRGSGAVVLFHDGGGDRAQTVGALDRMLASMARSKTRFTTVTGGLGLPTANVPVSMAQRVQGLSLVWAQRLAHGFAVSMTWILSAAGALTGLRLLLLVISARRHVRRVRRSRRRGARPPELWDPVSVIVPAYNEEAGIEATIRSLLASTHEYIQVVVVDDGSEDRTFEIAQSIPDRRVFVIRQANSGKASALNTGIAWCSFDIVVMIDGDTVFEPDAIHRLIQPLADPSVGAVSGNTKVGNRGGLLGRWQHLEYVIGFNLDRRMFDVLECMPTVPGAIGAFRREALDRVGGLSEDTLAEDTDLTMALCRDGWRVVYEESAIAWTEAPSSLRQLWRQRYRWCYGTLQAMWKHRRAVVERGPAGRFGRRGLTYLALFQTALPLLAPIVDVFAWYGLLFLDPVRTLGVWFAFLVVQLLGALYALRLDREPLGPLWSLPLQQFVYRQLMYLVVVQSVVTAALGSRLRWHRMHRTGSATEHLQGAEVRSG